MLHVVDEKSYKATERMVSVSVIPKDLALARPSGILLVLETGHPCGEREWFTFTGG